MKLILSAALALVLVGCAHQPPKDTAALCKILRPPKLVPMEIGQMPDGFLIEYADFVAKWVAACYP